MHIVKKEQPLISVIMGVRYRHEDLEPLKCAVESILQQSYQFIEFLICEQDSREDARAYLQQMAEQDERIHLVDGTGADTLAAKLNRCIAAAHGNWIARMDDDDISKSNRLEEQVSFLQSHPAISFVGCNVELIQGGTFVGIRTFPEYPTPQDFLFVQPFIHPTLLFRRTALTAIGGYCAEQRCDGCEDYDLLLRLYTEGMTGANLQKAYFQYNIPSHGQNKRTFIMRSRECLVRWTRFQALGMLPWALPYVIKPILVGLIPDRLLTRLKVQIYGHM